MIEDGLLALLTGTVTVEPVTDRDVFGRASAIGAAVTYRARVEWADGLIRDDMGREVPIDGVAYLEPAAALLALDTVMTLDVGDRVVVRMVKPEPDADGTVHHVKVGFGRA